VRGWRPVARLSPCRVMRRRRDTIELQPWVFTDRPRVLIEHPDPDSALELAAALSRAGCTVGICRGPDSRANPATRCPLHGLEPCVALDGADLAVTALDLDEEGGREVLAGLRTRYPNTPVVVVGPVGRTRELEDLLEGCTVVPTDQPEQVVAAVLDTVSPRVPNAH
jgi:hypothetical protein